MSAPQVSVLTIFLNEERFLAEAVESVLGQTYDDWELLLLDDGSTDKSTEIARGYAARYPDKIRYFSHPGGENRGMSATRNLGLRNARGTLLSFVDADDTLLPHKLAYQVPRLLNAPEIGMLYGATQYWFSWSGAHEDLARDYVRRPSTEELVFSPPDLLRPFLCREIAMPCPGSVLVRKSAVERVEGWVEAFRGLHEDQVFFTKMCLTARILVTTELVDRYRQHPDSCCFQATARGEIAGAELAFLEWLSAELRGRELLTQDLRDAIALRRTLF